MKHGAPYVFLLALAFLLVLAASRSIVVPLKAIVLNLLSVGASYGVPVLVFQHAWAAAGFRTVRHGITAGVVTSAALVMVGAFEAPAAGENRSSGSSAIRSRR